MLTAATEARRQALLARVDAAHQRKYEQYLTPQQAADLIASMPRLPKVGDLRVLDPGAGVGTLSAALVARIRREAPKVRVHLVASEIDGNMLPDLRATLEHAALEGSVTFDVHHGDFLDEAFGLLPAPEFERPFDLVIMNPPYSLLSTGDPHRRAIQQALGVDVPNLYAAFMATAHRLLRAGGQMVAIVPRSFANGPYYAAFRKDLLSAMSLDALHEFSSRSAVFADASVLQETVIVAATKGGGCGHVTLTTSRGHTDQIVSRRVRYTEVVHPDDPHQFIRIPGTVTPPPNTATLPHLGLSVSTGKVVDFRARDRLTSADAADSVPLIYPGNLRDGEVVWPRELRKPQGFIVIDPNTDGLLMPPGVYVVVKRFSAKEERRRVVAAVSDRGTPIAFENHLNVIHDAGHGLDRDLAVGLSLWLNSTVLDDLFREFSGHTQVNATDLRALPIPQPAILRHWGCGRPFTLPPQESIDQMVADLEAEA